MKRALHYRSFIQIDMTSRPFESADAIRARFSLALSRMYQVEVPKYGDLLHLVEKVNMAELRGRSDLRQRLSPAPERERLSIERHAAIRLGTPKELGQVRRAFVVMGMHPVGYYDLSMAGVPVHSTAFRPITSESLARNPFRVFTSLLRLDLIDDASLRAEAADLLGRRRIFRPRALKLISQWEQHGGLNASDADLFVSEVLETFRWHTEATVALATYTRFSDAHRLIADIVCFKGPHINHLTPRTLNIDEAQREMRRRGLAPKDTVEGPPPRRHPILLRQTSFKALMESVRFLGQQGGAVGMHTARFGEIEQRGMALTEKGRLLYDDLLARARSDEVLDGSADAYVARLAAVFTAFPDDITILREQGLAFFSYSVSEEGRVWLGKVDPGEGLESLLTRGLVTAEPLTYEDFLPVSAAGIFQSNLSGESGKACSGNSAQGVLEEALGCEVLSPNDLYRQAEIASIEATLALLHAK